jgi:hypothetical protein
MKDNKTIKVINKGGPWGGAYFLTFMGALVYFEQHANSFWTVILAFIKAIIWPAMVVHQILPLLHL